jgi:hypothetical protein
MSSSKIEFIDWIVTKKRTREEYTDSFSNVPASVFETLMAHLPEDADESINAQSDANFELIKQFLRDAGESLRDLSAPVPVPPAESDLPWDILVRKAHMSNIAFKRSSQEGIRARAELGQTLKLMSKTKGRHGDYVAELENLRLTPKEATKIMTFAKRCDQYPKFLDVGLGYTTLREKLPKILLYFKSGSPPMADQDPISPLYWKSRGSMARPNPNLSQAIILPATGTPLTPPRSTPVRINPTRPTSERVLRSNA